MTGVSDVSAEMTPKRLELLKLFAPDLRRVAILWDADKPGDDVSYRVATEYKRWALTPGLSLKRTKSSRASHRGDQKARPLSGFMIRSWKSTRVPAQPRLGKTLRRRRNQEGKEPDGGPDPFDVSTTATLSQRVRCSMPILKSSTSHRDRSRRNPRLFHSTRGPC